ncbi:MAG: diguanylate cyclase [Candidatus Edwardsbacteria bacterium RIFOXYD12_FULL_50_11]|uniref:Diguanylate cyclase n=1 Tax=Candidatus Edwardsbacteria bacterium GWF2_54_11 TaxID=1817851 RepID=A0A1F5RHG9_9BACT|nr:MAG: diguanylate cyclase [Candidatus Edwardsbacteria bacterium RifOxyC12_full_54_24]OGF06129.1 MAG: diguanylate cyclase [Candidatus Edwardsbacteria bacterium RifOxyA12_full_54_48]OGF12604.1 MAG: diguanylate cyclase [Candidatus Edwardsbacteria bacterium GWE2_54_12]OGF13859.1 MAG: diguanylate cyclase [Candidatus Edwardsbacteria bacterium GWF2_54_11]OGF17813.1 MAG: diguanylate cyclase [Candidatus Edwardsbacteria bacterium RIFOXYD12_FULL_50_11]OGJ18969.1 MAG: diguanylate cyclase [Candidatus Edw
MAGEWVDGFGGAVTVCDREGIILYMNDKAVVTFAKYGGRELIGRNLLDCHPEPARSKLMALMNEQRTNVYTIEKNGIKKLIHQSPWFRDGKYRGFVELSLEIPFDMPHFERK